MAQDVTRFKTAHTTSENGTHTTSKADYVAEWANEFYKAKKLEGISVATQAFYKQQIGHFLDFCQGQVIEQFEHVTVGAIRDYLTWLEESGHNPGGLHAAYRVLKTFLRWYENEAEPEAWKNPIAKVKAPKLTEEPLKPVELPDVLKMVEACERSFMGLRDRAILLTLLDTGLRAGELLRLDRDQVNETTGAVLVRVGKGRKPRSVFISGETRKAIRAYLHARPDDNPALWVTEARPERLKYGGLRVIIARRAKAAKVRRPALHDFRRAFALSMLRAGVDIISLARLMGHTTTKVLARYLHLVNEDLQDSHAKGSPVKQLKQRRGSYEP